MRVRRQNPRPITAAIFGIVALTAIGPRAAAQPSLEYEVKAAFLLNFTRFVDWPASAFAEPSSPFAICVIGKDPFAGALDEIVKGENVNGRRLVVIRSEQVPPARTCQIAYFGTSGKDLPKELAGAGPGVLTVGDGDTFAADGGMIAFVVDNRRVRFDINQKAAGLAGLKVSSRLLSVARTVKE
jgi:hypothetical protein